jgi:hypothetical protein
VRLVFAENIHCAHTVMLNLFQHPFRRSAEPFTKMDPETSSG